MNNMEELLPHAVVNQIQTDIEDGEMDALAYLLEKLVDNEDTKQSLFAYLSDSARENLLEGRTKKNYW